MLLKIDFGALYQVREHWRGVGVTLEQGRELAALIPEARFVPLESRNHWIVNTETAWRRFVSELDNFLPAPPLSPEALNAAVIDALTQRELQVIELVGLAWTTARSDRARHGTAPSDRAAPQFDRTRCRRSCVA